MTWKALAKPFSDSTFDLYQNPSQKAFRKQLTDENPPFWRTIKALFDIDLKNQILDAQMHYSTAQDLCDLTIPSLISDSHTPKTAMDFAWIDGVALSDSPAQLDLLQIATAWGRLHQHRSASAGALTNPRLAASDLAQRLGIQCSHCSPILADFRWDQFYRADTSELYLMDIDALLWGPVEWEWTLWEYLIPAEFIELWVEHYATQPVLAESTRTRLREILFELNALGWTDKHAWMNAPTYWPEP